MRHWTRSRSVACASVLAALSLVTATAADATTTGSSHGAAASRSARDIAAHSHVHPSTGASNIVDLGGNGWRVQSSAVATQSGGQISTPGFNASSWLAVANDDAGAPGTEVEALAQNGQCPDDTSLQPVNQSSDSHNSVFYSTNMKLCYGFLGSIGSDSDKLFNIGWWWRTDFTSSLTSGQSASLIVNGVVGAANVWVDGQQVATSSTVTGINTRFTFSLTSLLRQGTNSVAVEVLPNNPQTMFTVDDVDWNQIPPDNNTGIPFPV
ncbi:MAG TPA: beta galactosidase jelly roll domain-containing protein, partial [Streptosporangiaceae bacterium]|nr:beta galactosidase jelly roll domain-containing protein [Streptosporangiaceae bacterium]